MRKIGFAVALAVSFLSIGSDAQTVTRPAFVTGNGLYGVCTDYDLRQPCESFIIGVHDSISVIAQGGAIRPIFCIPQSVSNEQIRDVVIRFLVRTPETRHHYAAVLIPLALREVWPC